MPKQQRLHSNKLPVICEKNLSQTLREVTSSNATNPAHAFTCRQFCRVLGMLDPNINAYREDAAAETLRGIVVRERYLKPQTGWCSVPISAVRESPQSLQSRCTEIIYGEPVHVFESTEGWSWIQSLMDGYVGYVPTDHISHENRTPWVEVGVPIALVHADLNLAGDPKCMLPCGSRVVIDRTELSVRPNKPPVLCGHIANLGWIAMASLTSGMKNGAGLSDIAAQFLGSPYLWGGRTALGIDCSGLVQLCFRQLGIQSPRDVYMQRDWDGLVTQPVSKPSETIVNDLLYLPGHVAIVSSSSHCIHACGQSMIVREESLESMLNARSIRWDHVIVRRANCNTAEGTH